MIEYRTKTFFFSILNVFCCPLNFQKESEKSHDEEANNGITLDPFSGLMGTEAQQKNDKIVKMLTDENSNADGGSF